MSQLKTIQDEDLPPWLPRLAANKGPRFLQIADALQAAVADGSLTPGERLPPQRQLAAQLGVDLTTITRAYDEARRRNLLEGRGARGTYVAAPKVELNAILDLSMNTPPPPAGVDFDDMLKQGLSQVLMRADNELLMTYHLGGGSDSDRKAGATWLAPMFGPLDSQQLLVCPGAQAAIAALILALTKPGDVILAEPMSYPGLRTAAAQFGRRLIAVAADQHGMLPEMLEQACRQHQPGLVYLNPTLQNPTAITMPERRRKQLASIAQRCHVRIVEDDPYWLLADVPPPPIATFAPQQVLYISTLSKCLTPGLRIAFVLIRDPIERERFLVALRSFALMAGPLTAALATQWILDGSAGGLMEGIRKEARLRHRMARDILAGRYSGSGDGLHVWLELPAYWNSSQLAHAAASYGIAVTPAEAFATGSGYVNAIRISLGSIKDRGRLRAGLQRVSELLARRPEGVGGAVV
ncbi:MULTISPECIES: PLP-dependent aminotransferase family protein [unclassified Janthinobacterium]|uniref:aminotransferase-like domain-containing protein n=1 Tax=unclassified Janthinobacterium TaxID=2610881 RepID=UPI0016125427|nr:MULTISPECIES: PLP-dependent aminotransferase family protein [unclassified Janthinobacterium]MBB5369324.1 DNA-binding transcriptional MocR family regulator [Janthinobacterium sp. K2C7]MBB5381140.1 DNA-binding transcriptional MocR family regulator [Janthinobacterium sp. K2Li3]MBB5387707.1 DNA-binding transcriptional MocR family regulator [Janthinobacterium sp. K2E3]